MNEDLKRLAECSICFEIFRDPRTLPCGHIFCLRCLQHIFDGNGGILVCPECRLEQADLTNVTSLPKNLLTVKIVEVVEKLNSVEHMEIEKGVVVALQECEQCNRKVMLTDLLYCARHRCSICGKCAVFKHKPCDIIPSEARGPACLQACLEDSEKLSSACSELRRLFDGLEEVSQKLVKFKARCDDEIKAVDRELEHARTLLKAAEGDLHMLSSMVADGRLKRFEITMQAMFTSCLEMRRDYVRQCNDFKRSINLLLENASTTDASHEATIIQRIGKAGEEFNLEVEKRLLEACNSVNVASPADSVLQALKAYSQSKQHWSGYTWFCCTWSIGGTDQYKIAYSWIVDRGAGRRLCVDLAVTQHPVTPAAEQMTATLLRDKLAEFENGATQMDPGSVATGLALEAGTRMNGAWRCVYGRGLSVLHSGCLPFLQARSTVRGLEFLLFRVE